METNTQKYQVVATKALAVIGLLAVLLLISFSAISLFRYAGKPFSSLLAAAAGLTQIFVPAPHLNLVADSTSVQSGSPVSLTWTMKKQSGAYAFSYACLDGFRFDTKDASGKVVTIACGTPFTVDANSSNLIVTPVSTKNHYVDMPVLLTYTANGSETINDSSTLTLTVSNENLGSASTPVTPSKPATGTGNTTHTGATAGTPTSHTYTYPGTSGSSTYDNPNGTADLAVSVIETGVLDKFTNAFASVATSSLSRNDRIAVRFVVENLGTKSSGNWHFNVVLPTYPPETFNSDTEPSLAPGDKIEFTIGFDQVLSGPQVVKFVIDPTDSVKEVSETNNTVNLNLNLN